MLARHVPDSQLRAVLAAMWGYVGLPPSRLVATIGAWGRTSYHEHGAWYPEGGARAISDALATVLQERGGDIRYGRRVTGIEFADDHATAVVTDDGQRHQADLVVSNASAPRTMSELLDPERLPAEYVHRVQAPAAGYTTFGVYLGLERDVFAELGLPHELMLAPSYDHDAMFDAALRGDWDQAGVMVTDYTRVDPGCAPPGHGAVVITTVASWDFEDTWGTGGDLNSYGDNPRYRTLKERVADALVTCVDRSVPGLASAVRVREASTPLTNFRYTANPRGAIEGYENTPENSGLGWLGVDTPIQNLFLAGAWTNSGGMNMALRSGVEAARSALLRALPATLGA
jgi:prolycopene isomerase